jgi:hypothetical protein
MKKSPQTAKDRLVRTHHPLVKGEPAQITIEHENVGCVQYEFYIPATVYLHTATRRFLSRLGKLAPGATISKGAIGSWEGGEEDVNVYRLILSEGFDREEMRANLHAEIADVMAALAESKESVQQEVIFTEVEIRMDRSRLVKPTSSKSAS